MLKSAVLGALLLSSGCATIFTGTSDKLTVSVPGCEQASCKAFNSVGEWPVDPEAREVVVRKHESALMVVCETQGLEPVAVSVPPDIEGWVWGNILLGGVIGALVDLGTDGLYTYGDSVEVPMNCDNVTEVTAPEPGDIPNS